MPGSIDSGVPAAAPTNVAVAAAAATAHQLRCARLPPALPSQEVKWHSQADAGLQQLELDSGGLVGLVLNVRSSWLLPRLMGGRHWLALKQVGGRW